jgi:asparagine synthase (glutamine-hydrolysing)
MCGIAGYVASDPRVWSRADEKIAAAISYRGPDALTQWSDGRHVTLHHARLSIIDVECGGQPMVDSTDRFVVVFNGAIYNYTELRQQYERAGAMFRSNSDTEVLLNGFALKRERVVHDLNGMFAFAIWDTLEQRLFLARDRLGKKPLFWTSNANGFMFASTIDALRQAPGWRGDFSRAGLVLYSFLGGFPGETTAFEHARALPAAHFAWYTPGDAGPRVSRYWLPQYGRKSRASERATLDEYESILSDAVRIRLRSDVPLALSFSGGTDSGSIAALARAHSSAALQCYTIDYDTPEDRSAEVAIAARVAHDLRLPWRHIQYDYRAELLEGLDDAYREFDQPCQQLPLVYSRRLHDVMGQHCRVVVSGNGADELFTGYVGDEALLGFDRRRRWLRHVPDGLFGRLAASRRTEWNHVRLDRLTMAEWTRRDYTAYASSLTNDASTIDECRTAIDALSDEFAEAGIDTLVDLVMHRGLVVSATDTNYRIPDITGYAAHVEVRSPFLDYRMVEFAARLPPTLKIRAVRGRPRAKYLPRRFYERFVGADTAWNAKRTMGDNLRWFREFVGNQKFENRLADAYRRLHDVHLRTAVFADAYQQFREAIDRNDSSFPSAGTMMNGFMLGVWLGRRNVTSERVAFRG